MIMMVVVIRMKHLVIMEGTWETLHHLKRPGETFDKVIERLITSHKEYVTLLQDQVQVQEIE